MVHSGAWKETQALTVCILLLQAWAGEPDNVKKAQDILYQLAVANGQAQVGPRRSCSLSDRICALNQGCCAEQGVLYAGGCICLFAGVVSQGN